MAVVLSTVSSDGSDGQMSSFGLESVLVGHPVDGVRHAGLDPRVSSAHRHALVFGVDLLVESGDHLPLAVGRLVARAEAAVLVGDHGLADDSDGQLGGGRNGNESEEDHLFQPINESSIRKRNVFSTSHGCDVD